MSQSPSFSLPAGREKLSRVVQGAGDIVHISDAAETLQLSRARASKLLSRWAEQGWLRRVGPGAYVPVPIDLLQQRRIIDDPWMLVPAIFDTAYIGGRTAAEHWDLTEQIFRDVVVFTRQKIRSHIVERDGFVFSLRHIPERLFFGTKTVWRRRTRVSVSDVHRTIIDMIDDPQTGAGIQHVEDCWRIYLKRSDCDFEKLISYAERVGNRAIFKRLGFLAERNNAPASLVDACRKRLSMGNARLDPTLPSPRLVTRWRLRVPDTWLAKHRD